MRTILGTTGFLSPRNSTAKVLWALLVLVNAINGSAQSSTNTTVTVNRTTGLLLNATNIFSANTNLLIPAIEDYIIQPGGALATLNGLSGSTQTFAVDDSGSDFNIVSSGSTHTFNLPFASSTIPGKLSHVDWQTFNAKVGPTRQVIAGSGLSGGGALSGDVTLTLSGSPALGTATATSINGTTIPTSKTLVVTTDTIASLASTTSLQLSGVLSDESGSGAALFGTSPTITTPTISGAISFPAGTRQTFNPNSTTPGLNVGAVSSDPSSLSNGDVWLQSTSGRLRARLGGSSVDVATGAQQDFELTTVSSSANIAVDLNANQFQTLTLSADTALTTSNRSSSKGRAVTLFVTASGAQRIVTLNASWKNYGSSSTVTIPSGKEAVISLMCLGSAETDVRVDYRIQP